MALPSNEEQLSLELINRLRTDPNGEFARLTGGGVAGVDFAISYFGVDRDMLRAELTALDAVAPLAWNGALADAAQTHTDLLKAQDAQSHQQPGEANLGQRAIDAGYDYTRLGESVFSYADTIEYGHAGFVIDWGYGGAGGMQAGRGHRANMMNPNYTEIGIGHAVDNDPATHVGTNLITQDFGLAFGYAAKFVGVVIDDEDGDSFYDIGEGLSGVTIVVAGDAGTFTTQSGASGGWQIAVPAGTYTITFSGGGLGATLTRQASIEAANVKIDAIAPDAFVIATPTERADRIAGDVGHDLIRGLGGGDTLNGSAGNDTLDGGKGADSMVGGMGNDAYVVDNAGDRTIELAGQGEDSVTSSVSFSLAGQYVESLTLSGRAAINATGNKLDNTLTGNSAGNVLAGGKGSDVLTGDAGGDRFVFDTALAADNVDVISDFHSPSDSIRIDDAVFKGLALGLLSPGAFKNIAQGVVDASDRILYDADSGDLFFDRDGSGTAYSAVRFAELANHATISASDFLVI